MANAGTIVAKLQLDSRGFRKGAKSAGKSALDLGNAVSMGFTKAATSALKYSAALLAIDSAAKAISKSVGLAATAEQTQVAFEVALGSAERAEALVNKIKDFSASTPFQLPDLLDTTRTLMSFGVEADKIPETLKMLGDAAAGTNSQIGELAAPYGKMLTTGKAGLETLNQFAERGVPIYDALAANLDVSKAELFKLISAGKVGFPEFQKAFASLTAEGSQFGGMMEKQSATLAGKWSTFKDNVSLAMTDVGAAIIDAFNLKAVVDWSTTVAKSAKGAVSTMRDAIAWIRDNWVKLFETVKVAAQLHVVATWNRYEWLFMDVLPTAMNWLSDNWQNLFTDLVNISKTALSNIADNIVEVMAGLGEAMDDPVKAWQDGIDFDFKGLTDGFESTVGEFPEIAQRQKGPLEKQLTATLDSLTNGLASSFVKAIAGDPAKGGTDGGDGSGKGGAAGAIASELATGAKFTGAKLAGSADAYSTIVKAMGPRAPQAIAAEKTAKNTADMVEGLTELRRAMLMRKDKVVQSFTP